MPQEEIHEFDLVEVDDTGQEQSDDTSNSRSNSGRMQRWSRRMVQLLLCGAVIYLLPTWKTTSVQQPDGSTTSVLNIWIGLTGRVQGNPPNWQQWKMHDGRVLEGWLRDGLRSGWWNLYDHGLVIERIEYHRDKEVAREVPNRGDE